MMTPPPRSYKGDISLIDYTASYGKAVRVGARVATVEGEVNIRSDVRQSNARCLSCSTQESLCLPASSYQLCCVCQACSNNSVLVSPYLRLPAPRVTHYISWLVGCVPTERRTVQ
jgi:hypothetical protein